MNDFPRRNRIDKMTEAELAIRDAIGVVEEAGADVRLTDAVILLSRAQARVADFVDGVEGEAKLEANFDEDEATTIMRSIAKSVAQIAEQGTGPKFGGAR